MTATELRHLTMGLLTGLKKAKVLFRDSTDAKGGCKTLSQGEACRCFLCLVDAEIAEAERVMRTTKLKCAVFGVVKTPASPGVFT